MPRLVVDAGFPIHGTEYATGMHGPAAKELYQYNCYSAKLSMIVGKRGRT